MYCVKSTILGLFWAEFGSIWRSRLALTVSTATRCAIFHSFSVDFRLISDLLWSVLTQGQRRQAFLRCRTGGGIPNTNDFLRELMKCWEESWWNAEKNPGAGVYALYTPWLVQNWSTFTGWILWSWWMILVQGPIDPAPHGWYSICILNDDFCMKTDEFCIKNDGFWKAITHKAGRIGRFTTTPPIISYHGILDLS